MQSLTLLIFVTGAVLAALAASLGMAGTVHLASRRGQGYFHWIFYAIVLLLALSSVLSGRDVTSLSVTMVESAASTRHPLLSLAQPLVSLLLLTLAGERLISHWLRRGDSAWPAPLLMLAFIAFWLGTVAAPALLGAHPHLSHDYVYPLIIGMAAALASAAERDQAVRAARNVLVLFMAASVLLMALQPRLVLDTAYNQGLLPGVPRLTGLAWHAVSLGILAQLGLLCLLAYPYPRAWLNRLAWLVGLSVLFLAQSKTAWVSFVLCAACILGVRQGAAAWRRVGDPLRPEAGVLALVAFMGAVLAATLVLMFGDLGGRLESFFNSAQGAQLASLTGRDQIWAIAWQEWRLHPVFGYGPEIWETGFRISIGMPNATHAHNQFMDTLSRSGTVGALSLVLYALVLLVLSLRHARASRGLSLALFGALALRSLSEVPLSLFGYGPELLTHVLLLMTLAGSASQARAQKVQPGAQRPPQAARPAGLRAASPPPFCADARP
ncbi:MAG: O-antigen ligase family protein [Pseudomonadota bacterium]|nr:O-antigen ligase family protein [Pseudomonadota bacterium]